MPRPSHSSRFDYPNNIWWWVLYNNKKSYTGGLMFHHLRRLRMRSSERAAMIYVHVISGLDHVQGLKTQILSTTFRKSVEFPTWRKGGGGHLVRPVGVFLIHWDYQIRPLHEACAQLFTQRCE
jgi:hypothetical protein